MKYIPASRRQELTVDETAAQWRIRLLDPHTTDEERLQFEQWYAAMPENATAYEAMQIAWDAAAAEAGDPEVRAMREAALRFKTPRQSWLPGRAAAAAAMAAVAIGIAVWFAGRSPPASHSVVSLLNVTEGRFETAVGERSTVRLGDGSVVTLNTSSQMQVDLSGAVREVRLLRGQAIFEVAQDKARPFIVFAADRKITALGTAFDVRVENREVRVTLVNGKVAVDQLAPAAGHQPPVSAPAARSQLEPGEQLVAPLGGAAVVQGADIERITSWREGRLIFEADRLADALTEMNRYAATPIVLDDAAIGDLRLSGVFRTGQPAAFANALEKYFPLQAADQGGRTVLRWRR